MPRPPDSIKNVFSHPDHKDIFSHPDYAGLSWSIDPDTPWDERETAHFVAATVAKWRREEKGKIHYALTHAGPYNPLTRMWLCCNKGDAEIHNYRLVCDVPKNKAV